MKSKFTQFVGVFLTLAFALSSMPKAYSYPGVTGTKPATVVMGQTKAFFLQGINGWYQYPNGVTLTNTGSYKSVSRPIFFGSNTEVNSSDVAFQTWQIMLAQNAGFDAFLYDETNGPSALQFLPDHPWLTAVTTFCQTLDDLSKAGYTNLKFVPDLGGQGPEDFSADLTTGDNRNAIQWETDFFLNLYKLHPNIFVLVDGKPLFVYFHGAAQAARGQDNAWWEFTDNSLFGVSHVYNVPYNTKVTVRHCGGFMGNQPGNILDSTYPSRIAFGGAWWPENGYYTWTERLDAFAYDAPNGKAEQGSASLNNISSYPDDLWGHDAALVNNGATLTSEMNMISSKDTTFVLVPGANEYPTEIYNGIAFVASGWGPAENQFSMYEPNTLFWNLHYKYVWDNNHAYKASRGLAITQFGLSALPVLASPYQEWLDRVLPDGTISGWAWLNEGEVDIWDGDPSNGGQFLFAVNADEYRSDVTSIQNPNKVPGLNPPGPNHAFSAVIKGLSGAHDIHAYAVNSTATAMWELQGSPINVTFPGVNYMTPVVPSITNIHPSQWDVGYCYINSITMTVTGWAAYPLNHYQASSQVQISSGNNVIGSTMTNSNWGGVNEYLGAGSGTNIRGFTIHIPSGTDLSKMAVCVTDAATASSHATQGWYLQGSPVTSGSGGGVIPTPTPIQESTSTPNPTATPPKDDNGDKNGGK